MSRDEARNGSRVSIDLSSPDVGAHAYREALGLVCSVLGEGWLAREIDESRRGGYLLLDGPEGEGDDPFSTYLRQQRLMTLAWELDGARSIQGFDHLVRELRTRPPTRWLRSCERSTTWRGPARMLGSSIPA